MEKICVKSAQWGHRAIGDILPTTPRTIDRYKASKTPAIKRPRITATRLHWSEKTVISESTSCPNLRCFLPIYLINGFNHVNSFQIVLFYWRTPSAEIFIKEWFFSKGMLFSPPFRRNQIPSTDRNSVTGTKISILDSKTNMLILVLYCKALNEYYPRGRTFRSDS